MKNQFFVLYTLLTSLLLMACSSDDDGMMDNERPEITIHTPEVNQQFNTGDEFFVSMTFNDNVALSSYKFDIHMPSDGHSHRSVPMHDEHELEGWSFEVMGDLEGKEQTIDISEIVPDDATHGLYHFHIIVLDESGNEARAFRDVIIGDYEPGDGEGELQVNSFELLDRAHQPHKEILFAHSDHWHEDFTNGIILSSTANEPIPGSSAWYERGPLEDQPEAVSLGVKAYETQANEVSEISIPNNYRLEAIHTLESGEDALYISASHGDHLHLVGTANGYALIAFQLVRQSDGEVVYTSPEIGVVITD